MKRTGPVFFALVLAVAQNAFGGERRLVAEGDYSVRVQDEIKPVSHWKLWRLSDGGYEVVDTRTMNSSFVQRFRFDAHFTPIGYIIEHGPVAVPLPNFREVPGGSLACSYKAKELRCDAESDGRKSTASMPAQPPYVVIGEFYGLDFPWFMTGLLHLASTSEAKDGVVNVYALTDGTKPDEIGLKLDGPMKVTFVKEETAEVLGKTQLVREYKSNLGMLRESAQGLVVSVSRGGGAEFVVANYKEYEPWAVLNETAALGEGITDMPAKPGPVPDSPAAIQRRHVSSGVMQGLLVHRGEPIYPESAKQNHIQGEVMLDAVISTSGDIIDLKPISGPRELVTAAIIAVRQWKYRPYLVSGQPVEVETSIRVGFRLKTER
jgi:protein TonB